MNPPLDTPRAGGTARIANGTPTLLHKATTQTIDLDDPQGAYVRDVRGSGSAKHTGGKMMTTGAGIKTPSTTWDIRDKTVLVTGGTSGIGYETARNLAARGATAIITGRDAARGAAAVAGIQQHTPDAKISFLRADLSSLAEVRRLAEHVTASFPQLNVLVNNMGGDQAQRQTTKYSQGDIEPPQLLANPDHAQQPPSTRPPSRKSGVA